ncbi:4Fe-4S ferredoxin iron-sulfur binding domain protein [Shewanella halifaxensis HAW-EB4]|uniref:4Fe-4S ferredoxin iron-sulfur binding domain protein n=1 Tax=Shewanella halifaxensis (strain HAW-EB4) TaxID=458817 RepID=B0TRQ5_SHEHH|nr:4Fe-4S dicluster domain-containing protein [Shewanella halifaxensis]ABZ77817.1 4Fe-4S ferredoxin iron-sulfur binding domain protein [Shewanella halifaxensis HAW-EB4]
MNEKFVLIHDENRCIGCHACTAACNSANELADHQNRASIDVKGPYLIDGELHYRYLRVSCEQCDRPACIRACPYGAISQTIDGVVSFNHDRCKGCLMCVAACPTGGCFYNKQVKATDNCDFCMKSRVAEGLQPACVTVCPADALIFGNANDPNSEVHKHLSTVLTYNRSIGYDNKPKLYRVASQVASERSRV